MELSEKPIRIVAGEWDRFGGRCNEIINSYLVSKVLGCDFKFLWPKVEMRLLGNVTDQLAYFSDEFVNDHCCDSIDGPIYALSTGPEKSKDDLLSEIQKSGFKNFKLNDNRRIALIRGVDTQNLYKSLSETIWSENALNLKEVTRKTMNDKGIVDSIHIRSGDLLNGAWRQYPDIEKYVPVSVLFAFLDKNTENYLAIISDTFSISDIATKKYPNTISNIEIHHETKTDDFLVDLQDLFIMSFSKRVFAPKGSVFSILGARLGGSETTLIYNNFTSEDWNLSLKLSLDPKTYLEFPPEISNILQVRDIAWLIDRLWGQLEIEVFDEATRIAALADESFVLSLSQRSIALLLNGNFLEAEKFALAAKELAQLSLTTHGDPLYYALVAELAVSLVRTICSLNLEDDVLSDIRIQFQKIFAVKNVYQIPKASEVDFNLREALEKFDDLIKIFMEMKQSKRISFLENSNLFEIATLNEFCVESFKKSAHQHFLTRLTKTLNSTIDVVLKRVLNEC